MNKNETVSYVNYNPLPEWERWTGSERCPKCGSEIINVNTQIILTSNPPQRQLCCGGCGHYFSSGVKAEWTNNDALNELWEHDQSILNIPQVGDWPPGPTITDPAPGLDGWKPFPIPDESNKATGMYGWICPKCGRALAPHVNSCPYCSGPTTINITY